MPRRKKEKRDYGEGTVFLRSDGRWVAAVRHDGHKIARTARDEKTANLLRKQLLKELEQGLNMQGPKFTVQGYLEYWLNVHRSTIRATTYVTYRGAVKRLSAAIGNIKLQNLKADKLQLAYTKMLDEGIAATTIRLNHRVLKAALRYAVTWGYLPFNPAKDVTPPRESKRDYPILTIEESTHLLNIASGSSIAYLRTFLAVALGTGLRKGEILGLRWNAVDLETKKLHV